MLKEKLSEEIHNLNFFVALILKEKIPVFHNCIYIVKCISLLEVQLPNESSCPSVGSAVGCLVSC